MAARVHVDGVFKCLDVKGFIYPSFNPVMLGSKYSDVLLAEVVVVVASMLQHGQFVLAKSIGGFVLLKAGINCSFRCSLLCLLFPAHLHLLTVGFSNSHPLSFFPLNVTFPALFLILA